MTWIVEVVTAPYAPDNDCGCAVIEDCHIVDVATADEALDAVLLLQENPALKVRVLRGAA